jgi:Zn-dependent protease
MEDVSAIMSTMIALISALTVHEWAHAFAAKWQGDDTAKDEGRLTLNPIPHMDMLGTLILPLSMAILSSGGGMFGWAKPVPVTPSNFKNKNWGHAMVAFAGPLSNLLLVLIGVIVMMIHFTFFVELTPKGSFFYPLIDLLVKFIKINAILAFFNLIPVPPLDGGSIFPEFLPRAAKDFFEDYIAPYGMYILMALMFTGNLGPIFYMAHIYVVAVYDVIGSVVS